MSAPPRGGGLDLPRALGWAKKYGQIQSPTGRGRISFVPNAIQADFIGNSRALRGYPIVDAVIKPRQCGFSTLIMLMLTGFAWAHPGISMIFICPSDDVALQVRAKWKIIQSWVLSNPKCGLRSGHKDSDSADEFSWSNGSRITFSTVGGTQSVADAVGRGGTFSLAVFSEMAFPASAALMSAAWDSVLPALEGAGASIIIDSTPNGIDGPGASYARAIKAIYKGDIEGTVYFWEWWKDPRNRRDLPCSPKEFVASMTAEEHALAKAEELTLAQLQFRRRQIKASLTELTPKEARRRFRTIYPEKEDDVFLPKNSGSLFEDEFMDALRLLNVANNWPLPLPLSELQALVFDNPLDLMRMTNARKIDKRRGFCRIWEAPKRGQPYFIGADFSDGLPGGDWQCATVIDNDGRVVARMMLRVEKARFAAYLQRLATFFNNAWIQGEEEDGEIIYRHVTREKWDDFSAEEAFPGEMDVLRVPYERMWLQSTNKSTRPAIVRDGFWILRHGDGAKDAETLGEMESLFRDASGKVRGKGKKHDDIFMSTGIAGGARRRASSFMHLKPKQIKLTGATRAGAVAKQNSHLTLVELPGRSRQIF